MQNANGTISAGTKDLFSQWLENKENGDASDEISRKLIPALKKEKDPVAKELLNLQTIFY